MMEETKETRTLGDYPLYQQKIEAKVKGLIDMLFSINNSYDAKEMVSLDIDDRLKFNLYIQGPDKIARFGKCAYPRVSIEAKDSLVELIDNQDYGNLGEGYSLSIFNAQYDSAVLDKPSIIAQDVYHHIGLKPIPNRVFYVRETENENACCSCGNSTSAGFTDLEKGFNKETDIQLINLYFKVLDTAFNDTKKVMDYVKTSKK